ncbi:class A beta-lactamase [Variovorax sp. HJSM1_2]|uniref:class A beta-lactamase n=1 Tax=Variovorax sp. HJSM1_2 TaxID=3366263 RepID=UPI003BBC288D
MLTRRTFTGYGVAATALLASPGILWARSLATDLDARFVQLEKTAQGRLGVYILDTATGQGHGYRADERFMMLSSFKTLASALVLARVDRKQESLERRIRFEKNALVDWSPITEKHVGGEGMTLAELCHATITTSDNTAANLILQSYGGPKRLTQFLRSLGDQVTRTDRTEPSLNLPAKNEPLDTTTPKAMTATLQKLLFGSALSPASRTQLQQWLEANTTGGKRLRAGLPAQWRVGEKTGTNKTGANDVGFVVPPQGKPWLVTAYLAESQAPMDVKEAALAGVGALLAQLAG